MILHALLTMSKENNLKIMSGTVENVFLHAPTKEKFHEVSG